MGMTAGKKVTGWKTAERQLKEPENGKSLRTGHVRHALPEASSVFCPVSPVSDFLNPLLSAAGRMRNNVKKCDGITDRDT